MQIGKHEIGTGRAYLIAELGINHNGDMSIARALIDAAADAGVDAVKGQKRTVEVVYAGQDLSAPVEANRYGWRTREEYVRGRELSIDQHWELSAYAASRGLHYACSAWDAQALSEVDVIDPHFHKIASALLTDRAMLEGVVKTGRPIIASTGMSSLEQVDTALRILSDSGQIALLHCMSAYPANDADLNLRCIQTLRDRFGVPVGYSGHERGIAMSLAAVALGACIIERHITLDRAMFGSDQAASLEPDGLRRLVRDIRNFEEALGDGVKRVHPNEEAVMRRLRRSA
jgi:N-acetylneuraminate synthase